VVVYFAKKRYILFTMKVVFFGTPDLSVPFLEALTNEPDFEVVAVITQPDRPVGRKQILTPSPVKELAVSKNIPVFQPENLKKDQSLHGSDIAIVVAYGKIIPQTILNIPRLGCVNVHPSLLPKYRGPSPIQTAIMNNDKETGISIMLLDAGMDSGPLLAQETFPVEADETQESLTEKIKKIGPTLLIKTLRAYAAGKILPQPQDKSKVEICKMLDRDSGRIDWTRSTAEINAQVRALHPWPGCWTTFERGGKIFRLKILKTKIEAGKLVLLEVQPEGRSPMSFEEFERGYGKVEMK
jgi:methionyl-tRNA formyltransferase